MSLVRKFVKDAQRQDSTQARVPIAKAYNEDQPRDDHGRWGSGGSGASPTGRIPVKIGRRTLHAEYSASESALPNAQPTYRIYDKPEGGNYVMHAQQWTVDAHRVK